MPTHHNESIPLMSRSNDCDDDIDTISMPSISTTPPPYTDGCSTPRRPLSRPETPRPIFTPPTTASNTQSQSQSQASDGRPILNIYAPSIDADSIQHLFAHHRKISDVAPVINLHVRSNGYYDDGSFQVDDIAANRGDVEQGDHKTCLKHPQRKKRGDVGGQILGFCGIVFAAFCVWAILNAVVKITTAGAH